MQIIKNWNGENVRLTAERRLHILDHPEMANILMRIEETLVEPDIVVQSITDSETQLSFRYYKDTAFGDKYLCVVSKHSQSDAFIITAYLTDKIKQGRTIWKRRT